MDTPAAGPQASTRNSANRRPSYKHSSAQSVATLDQRLCHLESRRASNGKQNQGPILARSAAAIALDTDLETVEDQLEYLKSLTADLDETDRRLEGRLNFVEDARSTTQERLRKLEGVAELEALPLVSVAEQLRSRDERIERLENGLRARDERLKRLEETIQPYKLYLDKAKEADQKLNQSMMQIKTFLDSRKLSKSASPLVGTLSNANGAETKPRDEPAKPVLPQQSAEDIARSLIFMLAEGASIDEDVVFALNAAWAKSRNKKKNMESSKETLRNESLEAQDDSRPWQAPSKSTPVLHTPAEETSMQDTAPQQAVQAQIPDNSNLTSPFKSALKSRKRSPLPNGDQGDNPRKRVRISQPSTPVADQSSKADLNPGSGRKDQSDSPEGTESTPEVRRTPRSSQPRHQPKDMVSWKDANESLRGMRPR